MQPARATSATQRRGEYCVDPSWEPSCKCLQLRARELVAQLSVDLRRLCRDHGPLRIYNFKRSALAIDIAKIGEAQALARGDHAGVKRTQLLRGQIGFAVELFKVREQPALRCTQHD